MLQTHLKHIELKNYSKLGATSVGLDSNTSSEFEPSDSSRRSRDSIASLYTGVSLKSVAPSLYVPAAIAPEINCYTIKTVNLM